MTDRGEITTWLARARAGDPVALERVVEIAYPELRMLAKRQLFGSADATITPTALVHEAYLRLVGHDLRAEDRAQFFAACSTVMRNLVIDFARSRQAKKRGGDRERVTFEESSLAVDDQAEELLALDRALDRLADFNPRYVRVAECRFFAGLTEGETAAALGVSERTVRRDWLKGRALLSRLLSEEGPAA